MASDRSFLLLLGCALVACSEDPQGVENAGRFDGGAIADNDGGVTPGDGDGNTWPGDGDGDSPGNGDGDNASPDAGVPPVENLGSYQEVFDQGLTRYVGKPQVRETEVTTSGSGVRALKIHHFSSEDRGPICMYGDEFFVETREGKSNTLMIFLQGGGVCLSEVCAATPAPILSLQLFNLASALGIGGILDPENAANPTKDFDVVNAPYCDGSLFAGDVDRILSDGNESNGPEDQAYQRGLLNLTATLETAFKYFPTPPRIVLVGSSGGAYGVIAGTVLTRYYYPDTPLLVVSDSGAPIVNGIDKGFITRALTEFNAIDMIPRSCPDCLSNGHATGMLEWALRIDPKLSVAYMTHSRDHVIGEFFMKTSASQFEAAVVAETSRLIKAFPGRAFRFVIPSAKHTLAMGVDNLPEGLQGPFLGATGSFGVGFIGPDVNSAALSKWTLGGMKGTGVGEDGRTWVAYDWLGQLINEPENTPNVLQLD